MLFRSQEQRTKPAGKIPSPIDNEVSTALLPVFATADNHPCRDEPSFRAWLQDDALMTSGVTDDLAGEIVKLTTDDLPLQRRLLKLHCGIYSGPWWSRLVERWQERTAIMVCDGGLAKEEAEYQAAVCLRAAAFLDELRGVHEGI